MEGQPELSDYQQKVKSDAQRIRDLATKAKAEEIEDEYNRNRWTGQESIKNGSKEWNEIYNGYDWIVETFDGWLDVPDPKYSEEIVNQLGEVVGEDELKEGDNAVIDLNPGSNLLGNAVFAQADAVMTETNANWDGNAAKAFRLMMGNLKPALHNQVELGRILRQMAIANYRVVSAVRQDIRKLQKDTITALEANMDDPGFDWGALQMTLLIAGTAFSLSSGVAAVPAVAGILASTMAPSDPDDLGKKRLGTTTAAFSIFSAGLSLRSELPKEQKAKDKGGPLGAATVDGILENMFNGFGKIAGYVNEARNSIVKVCNDNVNLINSSDKNGSRGVMDPGKPVVVAPRPAKMVNDPDNAYKDFRPRGTKF